MLNPLLYITNFTSEQEKPNQKQSKWSNPAEPQIIVGHWTISAYNLPTSDHIHSMVRHTVPSLEKSPLHHHYHHPSSSIMLSEFSTFVLVTLMFTTPTRSKHANTRGGHCQGSLHPLRFFNNPQSVRWKRSTLKLHLQFIVLI